MPNLRERLSASTALVLVTLAPAAAVAANYAVDNSVPQTQADLPASPNDGFIIVGDVNPNQVLTINNSYSSAVLVLGNTAPSTGNQATITGGGTVYTNTIGNPVVTGPALVVGVNSTGNTLTIQNGASAAISVVDGNSAYDVHVGYNKGADGNILTVTGGGSSLKANASTIYAGYAGASNTLKVQNGATVSALQMRIGGGTGSLGAGNVNAGAVPENNVVSIDGAGSSLTLLGSLNLGATGGVFGGGNKLQVTDGATATVGIVNQKTLAIGQAGTSNGNEVSVTGTNSVLNAWNIVVGNGSNIDNVLKIGDAAQVNSSTGIAFGSNSQLVYGAGGTQQALATAQSGITIGSNVTVVPYIASPVGLQRTNTMLTLASGTTADQFAGLDLSELPSSFTAQLLQFSTHFDLDLIAQLGDGQGLNDNQAAVAGGINNAFNGGTELPEGFAPLFLDLTGAALQRKLTLISGEAATGAQQSVFEMGSGFLGLIGGPQPPSGITGMSGASGGSPYQRLTLWVGGYGGYAAFDGSDPVGSHRLTTRGGGAALGGEYSVTPTTVVGLALGGGASSWSLSGDLGGGRSTAAQLGLYGRQGLGAAYLAGALGFGNYWIDTHRNVDGDRLEADYSAWTVSGRAEAGYRVALAGLGLTPYAAVQVQHYSSPDYTEAGGSGLFALEFGDRSVTDPRSELGVRVDVAFGPATLRLRGAWMHDFEPGARMDAAFVNMAGSDFTVTGASRAHNAALISAGLDWRLTDRLTLNAAVNSEVSGQATSYNGLARLDMTW